MTTYTTQPEYPGAADHDGSNESARYLACLDVWEQHITALEDPHIREVALGGPDTSTRSKTICQVKLFPIADGQPACSDPFTDWQEHIAPSTGQLEARARATQDEDDPCILPPQAGFSGLENQLYCVEICRGSDDPEGPTFKWSRENGSLAFRIEEFIGNQPTHRVRVAHLGRDDTLSLRVGNWIDVVDDNAELAGRPGTMARITHIESAEQILVLSEDVSGFDIGAHAKVRRWDMPDGEILVSVPDENDGFILLEDGVEIRFSQFNPGRLRTGDCWRIATRTATADVEWPRDAIGNPVPQLPQGIRHHYCKLAIVENRGTWRVLEDCRRQFPTLCELELEEPPVDPGFHITNVMLRDANNLPTIPLVNDMRVEPSELARGIEIVCDDLVSRDSVVGKLVCGITLDVPTPLTPNQAIFPEEGLIGTRPLTLFARVDAIGERIIWEPSELSETWLASRAPNAMRSIDFLFDFMRELIFEDLRIRVTLTVEGNFIWTVERDDQGRLRYLDGTTFGAPAADHTDVRLPSGDNNRGGDFKMRFWLVPEPQQPPVRIDDVLIDPPVVVGGRDLVGTVVLTGPAPPNGITVLVSSNNPNVLSVPQSVTVSVGETRQDFTVQAVRLPAGGPAAVDATLTVSFGGTAVRGHVRLTRQ